MSFTRYERYKQSGVEWLGDVPEHWNTSPLLAVGCERDERNTGMAESNLLSLSYGRIVRKDISTNEGLLPESFETYQIVHPGDIVFRLTDLQNDKRSLRTAIVEERGIITSAYLALEPFSTNPRLLNYLFRAYDLRKVFYALGSGVRQSMNYEDVKRMEMLLPPIEEQAAIVAFLDRETAKIDALIEEQRRLTALLKEKRRAVISHAVTKGLNPSASMKDSGVEWYGQVPAHWRIGRVGRHVSILSGFAFPSNRFSDDEAHARLLRGVNVGVGRIRWDETVFWERTNDDGLDDYELSSGDLVIGMDRPLIAEGVRVAKIGAADLPCLLLQRVAKISTDSELNADFLSALLSSRFFIAHFSPETTGVSVPHISPEQIQGFVIPLPPIEEQKVLVDHLLRNDLQHFLLLQNAEQMIGLLEERRSALISAAVTGKINVTTHVAKPVLPTWSAGFARQVLAAETLSRCNGPSMGRVKLQKLIHLCEYHAQLDEVRGTYSRQAAGPFAPQMMEHVREGLLQQRWFEEYKDESRYVYRALEKAGGHKQYLPHWEDKRAKIDQVLNLLKDARTEKCEIASTLYAAWNDLLLEGKTPTDTEIIHEASSAESWHESKENIPPEKWRESLKWMRAKGLVPVGYGTHTTHQPDLFTREGHEPA
jgi:type I restriction enzyme, S subunit